MRFIVFGSFVTDKAAPNDVDVFLVMADHFDVTKVTGETRYVFDHMAAHNLLGASIFWIPRAACLGGEQAAVLDWQSARRRQARHRGDHPMIQSNDELKTTMERIARFQQQVIAV